MSVNKIQCDKGMLTLFNDYVIYHQDGVEFTLEGDGIPGFLKSSRKGNIFITTSKVVFAPSSRDSSGSFSMNFQSIRGVEVKQPLFGANHVKGDIISEPEGGWQGRGIFKIYFNSGGAIEFAENFRKAVLRARNPGVPPPAPAGHQQVIGQFYPAYPAAPPQQPYGPPPQQPYGPPPAGYYPPGPPVAGQPSAGYNAYPSAPPAPYMSQPPPAYTATENVPPPGSGAKAMEAYSSGSNVYVPQPQPPPYAPPPYSRQDDKKNV